jgi:hypothetical protein
LGLDKTTGAREAMRRIQRYFDSQFSYRTWQDRPREPRPPGETALGRFLTKTRAGHCEYFATATTLLLRRANIPARYAVGYFVHERRGDQYVVRLRDAHAWVLVWDELSHRWVNFDTTPASWIKEEANTASALEWVSDLWARFTFELAKFRWGQSGFREYLFLLIVPGLFVVIYQIIFRRRRRKPGGAPAAGGGNDWPGLDSEFYRLETAIAARGMARRPDEPLTEWLERSTEMPALTELRPLLPRLLRLHYQHRFDPIGLTSREREQLRAEVQTCLKTMAQLPSPAKK